MKREGRSGVGAADSTNEVGELYPRGPGRGRRQPLYVLPREFFCSAMRALICSGRDELTDIPGHAGKAGSKRDFVVIGGGASFGLVFLGDGFAVVSKGVLELTSDGDELFGDLV